MGGDHAYFAWCGALFGGLVTYVLVNRRWEAWSREILDAYAEKCTQLERLWELVEPREPRS